MKITTWNVNGVRAREAQVFDWLRREKPDVLCLQELKASLGQVPPSLASVEGYWSYWHGSERGYSGVSLHVSKQLCPTPPRFSHPSFDHESRIVTVELGELTVASIYVPNGGKDFEAKVRFLSALDGFVEQAHAAGRRLLLCGDLNVALLDIDVHPKLRDSAQYGQTPGERAQLRRILSRGLVDLGRHFRPEDEELFTWWAPWRNQRERNEGWRLDYVLASESLMPMARGCAAYREYGNSDHGPVTATFEGAVFDARSVVAGEVQAMPKPEAAPQLSLGL